MRRWERVVGIVGVVAAVAGCGSSDTPPCSDIGCDPDPSFEVLIRPDKAGLDEGSYEIAVATDVGDATITCGVNPVAGTCDGTTDAIRAGVRTNSSGAAAYIVVSVVGPSRVSLTVSLGGTVLATKDYAPTKSQFQPNGTGCGPVCDVFVGDKLTY